MKFHSTYLLSFLLMMISYSVVAQVQKEEAQQDFQYEVEKTQSSFSKKRLNRSEALIYHFLDSSLVYSSSDPKKAIGFIEEALEQSINMNDKRGEANCYKTLGLINFSLFQYDLSIENYNKAIDIFFSINDANGIYEAYKNLGMAYEANKDYELSLENYITFLEKARQKNKTEDIIFTRNKIARIYYRQKKYEVAIKTFLEILKLEEDRDNKNGIIDICNYLGNSYLKTKDNENALKYFKKSKEIAEELKDDQIIYNSTSNINQVYRQNKDYGQELANRMNSININTLNENPDLVANDNYEIGNVYMEQNKANEAIKYYENAIEISEETGNLDQKQQALQVLSTAYDNTGEPDKALNSYKEYVSTMDSLYKLKEKDLMASMELNSSLNKKLNRIEMLEKDKLIRENKIEALRQEKEIVEQGNKTQRIAIYSLIAGILVVSLASFFVYRSSKQKRKANQLLALKSLRSQMNPHFIFNALNSVNSFISRNDERSANKYLSDFSRLMRMVLENSKHDFVSLAAEVTVLELYLSLEHFRFKEKFDYTFDIDPALDPDAFEIPPMLIQPYIENSIWHGLRYKDDKGYLKVSIQQAGSQLEVIIEDNGIGRARSQELKTKNQKENVSTGMKNIENRVKIINDLHKSRMDVKVTDLNDDGSGTRVTIMINGSSSAES